MWANSGPNPTSIIRVTWGSEPEGQAGQRHLVDTAMGSKSAGLCP
jgi:hypothetical protein